MTPLRQRMLEDMRIRNLSTETQASYINHVARFARYCRQSPERVGAEEIRTYQLYLINERHLAPTSVAGAVAALRFLYRTTLQQDWAVDAIATPKRGDPLPAVLSPEEVVRFLDGVMDQKHRVILTTCYAARLRVSEARHLQIGDIDSQRMVLHVVQGKGNRDRYVMLSPTLLEQLRAWWRAARPATWLFPGQRPCQPMDKGAVQWACRLARVRSRLTKPVPAPISGPSSSCSAIVDWRRPRAISASPRRRSARRPARSICSRIRSRRRWPPPRADGGRSWIALGSRWRTCSAATATSVVTTRLARCRRRSGAS